MTVSFGINIHVHEGDPVQAEPLVGSPDTVHLTLGQGYGASASIFLDGPSFADLYEAVAAEHVRRFKALPGGRWGETYRTWAAEARATEPEPDEAPGPICIGGFWSDAEGEPAAAPEWAV